MKIKPVKSIKIAGKLAKKLGALDDELLQSVFIMETLSNVDTEEYIKFYSEHAIDQQDFDNFKTRLYSCTCIAEKQKKAEQSFLSQLFNKNEIEQ